MRTYWRAALIVGFALTLPDRVSAQTQQATEPKAAATVEAAVGTSIADRTLAGAAESFKSDIGKLYCFSKITGVAASDIEYVWYKGDAEVARVKQAVKGSPWRTWSSKTVGSDATGDWRCDIVQDGKVLQSVKFKVEK